MSPRSVTVAERKTILRNRKTMLMALDPRRATSKQTLGERVARRLREEIISGDLRPGAMLAEIPTAERLGVSRVPVREALLVLGTRRTAGVRRAGQMPRPHADRWRF